MASNSPISEPGSSLEENNDPSVTDEQMKNEIDIDSTQPDSKNDPKEDGHTDIKSDDPVHEDEESVNDEVAKLLKENKELKKQVQTMQDEIYEKDADIKSYNKVIDKKEAEAERQNCKIQQLEEDLTKKDDEIKSLKELQDEMEQLDQDLNKKDDEIESLKAVIILLEDDVKKHAHYSEELEKKKQILEEVHQAKLKQLLSQQTEIENLRCDKDALTESHKQLKSDNEALTEFQERLKTYISDTKKKTDTTTKELEKQIKQLENDLGKEKERRKKDIESKDKLIKKEHDQQQKVINEWKIKNQRLQDTYQKEFDRLSQFEAAYYSAVQDFNNQEKSIQTQLSTIKRQQSVIDRYRNENESKRQMISSLEVEKDNLLLRLSKITGAQLTYNNPNIADLSDDKRPTKLAEEFSELYDNEWTDAFECIEAEGDDRKTRVLYDLLKKSYEFCEALSIGHDKAIRNSFTTLNYTKSLSEVAHDGNIPNSSNESRSSSTDKKNENETQSSMDAANDDVKNDGGVHKQYVFIENASTHQQGANSEILNGDNIVTEAEKNKKKQQNENFEEKENDKTNSKEQQTTYARILDGANNVTNPYKNEVGESKTDEEMKIDMDSTTSKLQESTGPLILDGVSGDTNAGENQEKQQNETGEGNEKDKTARTPQYGTNSGSLNEVNDVTIASKNDKAGESRNNEEKEMIATTSTHQESTDPGILDGANNVTIASGEEKEFDDNRSPPQQGTVSEILDGVNHVNKTHKKEEEQQKTGEENVKDKNTSTPQDGTDSGSLNEINNVTIVSKNDKAGESKNNEENEKIETTSTHQESTDPGILDGVNNVTIASGGEKEFDDNRSPPQQGTISGILDGVNNVNITHKNEEEEQKTGVENVKNPITSTPQKGIESGISEGVNQVTNADTIENEVPRKISGRKKHDANKSPPQEDTDTDFLGGDHINTKSDRNKRKQNAEGTLIVNKEQIKVSELTLDFDDLSAEQKKTIMDLRKLCEERQADDVVQVGSKLIATEMQIENCEITKYISKCIDICWSMRRHTPPVYMDYSKSEQGLPFDKQKYRPYTKSGKFVHFVVWPVLYLHEGGPQLSKGVAQGIN